MSFASRQALIAIMKMCSLYRVPHSARRIVIIVLLLLNLMFLDYYRVTL